MRWLPLVTSVLAAGPQTSLEQGTLRLTELIKKQAWSDAALQARELEAAVAARAPLGVSSGRLLTRPAEGLGIYEEAKGGLVRGEEMFFYAEVRHYGLRPVDKRFLLHLRSDIIVLDEAGQELARDEGFGESRFTARARHRDTFVNIAVRATGLPRGKYRMRLVIHDKIGGKRGQVEIPFGIP